MLSPSFECAQSLRCLSMGSTAHCTVSGQEWDHMHACRQCACMYACQTW